MKVAIVSSWKDGGAGKAAFRLHEALLSVGHDSFFLFKNGELSTDDRNCIKVGVVDNDFQHKTTQAFIDEHREVHGATLFSSALYNSEWLNAVLALRPDVLNIHWVSGMIAPSAIIEAANKIPQLVVTLHDEWLFTGGCHYSFECNQYMQGCIACPQVDTSLQARVREWYQIKKTLGSLKNVVFTAPSKWMLSNMKANPSFAEVKSSRLFNAFNLDTFKPTEDRMLSRQRLGLPEEAFCIMLGAMNTSEARKGAQYLAPIFQHCMKDPQFRAAVEQEKVAFVKIGHGNSDLGIPEKMLVNMGHVDSDSVLAELYGACDVFVLPSQVDNMPNMACECMACEIPVISFDSGGISELVNESGCGVIVPATDTAAMAARLVEVIKSEVDLKGSLGRKYLQTEMSYAVVAKKFESLVSGVAPSVDQVNHQDLYIKELQSSQQFLLDNVVKNRADEIRGLLQAQSNLNMELFELRRQLNVANEQMAEMKKYLKPFIWMINKFRRFK